MNSIKLLSTGIIYSNPKPYLKSVHAYFPSVVSLGDGELLCSMVLGEAFESINCRAYLARSLDNGQSWQLQGRLTELCETALVSEYCRITAVDDHEVVAWVFKYDRSKKDYGLTNPGNMGFVPTEMKIYRSKDKGSTWHGPEAIVSDIEGPCFELCCPITQLSDGRWLAPTSTWRDWQGFCPQGMRSVNLVSYDKGKTWPEHLEVMDKHDDNIIFWEQKTIELDHGRLLSVAWTYDEKNSKDLENHYSVSNDGKTFGCPKPTGLQGQTPAMLHLGDNKVLTVYRRMDKPGLWANISLIENDRWVNLEEIILWSGSGLLKSTKESNDMVEEFQNLKFGAPCCLKIEDDIILVGFWCVEDCVSNIRWVKITIYL
jgi:sialidase-1